MSYRCLYNMVNFGPLTAEIDPVVWSTPANFNGFRILAALLHGTTENKTVLPGGSRKLYISARKVIEP